MADIDHSSFIGRRRELAELAALVRRQRLVTLTGVGGIGKTRLALRVASRAKASFPDGVALVEPGAPEDSRRLAVAMASRLGLREAALGLHQAPCGPVAMVTRYLAGKRLLLVLDSCERGLDACAELVALLLKEASGLSVLVTSERILGVFGENVRVVPPLSLPPVDSPVPVRDLPRYEAVQLFLARAVAAVPGFTLTAENCHQVLELCRRVEGIPLAIELTAARLRVVPLELVLDQPGLDEGAGTHPLRRTLQASHAACSSAQQSLWARLSVFAGGFELDAAESVCAGGEIERHDVLDLLAELIDRSVLTSERGGNRSRYRMLGPVREYGATALDAAGERDVLRQRHCDYFLDLMRQLDADWMSERQLDWLTRMRVESDNLRAAMTFCFDEGQARAGETIATVLGRHWFMGSGPAEDRHWLRRSFSMVARPSPTALWVDGWLAILQGSSTEGLDLLDRAQAAARQVGDDEAIRRVTQFRGLAALFDRKYANAAALFRAALALHREAGDLDGQWLALYQLAITTAQLADIDRALDYAEQCVDLCETHQARWSQTYAWWVTAAVRWESGDPRSGLPLLRDGLRIRHDLHDIWGTVLYLEVAAWIAADIGSSERAGLLLGGARRLWRSVGSAPERIGFLAAAHDRCEQQTHAALGDEAFTRALRRGEHLTTGQAVNRALDLPVRDVQPAGPPR